MTLPKIKITKRTGRHDDGSWRLWIDIPYRGLVEWVDGKKVYVSKRGTFHIEERLCSCSIPDQPQYPRTEAQPPPDPEEAGEFEKWWDRLCRAITYHPSYRLTWGVLPHFEAKLAAAYYTYDSYSEEWREQGFELTANFSSDYREYVDEGYKRIRAWIQSIALHEVDEWLLIDGQRRWDPHPLGLNRMDFYPEVAA